MFKTYIPTWGAVTVSFKHNNPQRPDFPSGEIPGTDCFIKNSFDKRVAVGETELCPTDTYCKELGRKLALTRAIKGLPRNERAMVWYAYFARLDAVRQAQERELP